MLDMGKPIGELQGWWAILLKVNLAAVPIIVGAGIAWSTWTTTRLFALERDLCTARIEAKAYTDRGVSGALAQVFLEISTLNTKLALLPDHGRRLDVLEKKP